MKKAIVYTDGSYSGSTGKMGYGVHFEDGSGDLHGEIKNDSSGSRNVVGETTAVIIAVQTAIERGYTDVVVCYDYEGVEKLITGEWTCRKPISQQYRDKMHELMKQIGVTFEHVKAHKGDEGNNHADRLAKQGSGIK